MNAVDTNVFIYALDDGDSIKRRKARILLRKLRAGSPKSLFMWQVMGELLRQLQTWRHQGRFSHNDIRRYIALFSRFYKVTLPTAPVIDRALDLADRYSLSHWDSMLLGACIEAGVTTLYTEDMGAPTQYDSVQLVNPFI